MTFFSFIKIDSPVDGFLPFLAFLTLLEKVPKPLISMRDPFTRDEEKKLRILSKVLSTSLLGR